VHELSRDGSLGFWIALQEEYGMIAQQRCWVHKTANILDKVPKSVQGKAKQLIHKMYLASTRKAALAAYDQFISSYQIKFPKACECLEKDKEMLFTFYDFPAQHWPIYGPPTRIQNTTLTSKTMGDGDRHGVVVHQTPSGQPRLLCKFPNNVQASNLRRIAGGR
jgi:transposase-like protein